MLKYLKFFTGIQSKSNGSKLDPLMQPTVTSCLLYSTHQGKLMGHPSVRRQFGSEAKCWEHLVAVVVLNDLADCLQGHGVGIQLVRAHVVQRGGLGWVSCEMQWVQRMIRILKIANGILWPT